jgi:hypothetical protein
MYTDYHLQNFLYTINVIADPDYQFRIWVKGLGPEVDTYAERMCCFFEDAEIILANYKKYEISDKQYQLIIQLRDALEIFSDEVPGMADPEKEILPNSEWKKNQKLAKKVLEAFDYKKDTDKDKYIFEFDE